MANRILLLSVMAVLLAASGCATTQNPAEKKIQAENYYYNALVMMNHGSYEKAEASLKSAIELKPDNYNSHIMLGKVYEKENKKDEALGAYQTAIKLDPKDARGYLAGMNVMLDQNRSADAAALGETAISAGAPKESMVDLLGWSYYVAGNLDKAETCYRSALELSPGDTGAMNNLGILLFTKGKYVDAISMFQVAQDKNKDSVVSPYLLALTYNKLGKEDDALKALKAAVDKDPMFESKAAGLKKELFVHTDPGDISGLFAKLKAGK